MHHCASSVLKRSPITAITVVTHTFFQLHSCQRSSDFIMMACGAAVSMSSVPQKLRWKVKSTCSRRWEMPRQVKRESATSSADAPPSKKSVPTKGVHNADLETPVEPRRSGRLVAAPQQPLPCAQSQAVKEEKKSCKEEDSLLLTSAAALPLTSKPNMNCRAAVDEFCPVSISTHV